MVFEHVDPMLRVKRSRASAPHRREPPGTGDALRMKSGHESETTRAGHNVRRVASVQFSAPHVDIRFEKLQRRHIRHHRGRTRGAFGLIDFTGGGRVVSVPGSAVTSGRL